jgi:hypothetical protein
MHATHAQDEITFELPTEQRPARRDPLARTFPNPKLGFDPKS